MSEIQRYPHPEVPKDPETQPVKTGLIGMISRSLDTVKKWIDAAPAVPVELKDIITQDQMTEALKIYHDSVRQDREEITSLKDAFIESGIGDYDRKLEKLFAILQMHFDIDVKSFPESKGVKMRIYCMKAMGFPGMSAA